MNLELICRQNYDSFMQHTFGGSFPRLYWPASDQNVWYQARNARIILTNYIPPSDPSTPSRRRFVILTGLKTEPVTEPVRRILVGIEKFAPYTSTDTFSSRLVKLFNGYLLVDGKMTRTDDGPWPTFWDDGDLTSVYPCLSVSFTFNIYPDSFSYPVIEDTKPRRRRIYGRSDRPAWRKIHAEAFLGKKFARQRDKLIATPNGRGFGNSTTTDWRDKAWSKAKKIAVDAAKGAVKDGAKHIIKQSDIRRKLKDTVANKLKEIVRKR